MNRFRTPYTILAALLWLTTAALGLVSIVVLRDLFFRLVARFTVVGQNAYDLFLQTQQAGVGSSILAVALGIVWIATFIGGIENHYRQFGKPGAWRPLAWVIGAEAAIFAVGLFA